MSRHGDVSLLEAAEAKQKFLAEYAKYGSVSGAARAADRTLRWAEELRHTDAAFAAAWDEAEAIVNDRIDRQLWLWAFTPERVPAISAGKWVHDDHGVPVWIETRDHHSMQLLARSRMTKYRTTQRDVNVSGSVEHSIVPSLEGAKLVQSLMAKLAGHPEAREALAELLLESANEKNTVEALPPVASGEHEARRSARSAAHRAPSQKRSTFDPVEPFDEDC